MDPLRTFYNNETQREALKEFMVETIREIAADKAIDGQDTSGIKEGRECIEQTFDKLEKKYGIIKERIIQNPK